MVVRRSSAVEERGKELVVRGIIRMVVGVNAGGRWLASRLTQYGRVSAASSATLTVRPASVPMFSGLDTD